MNGRNCLGDERDFSKTWREYRNAGKTLRQFCDDTGMYRHEAMAMHKRLANKGISLGALRPGRETINVQELQDSILNME